MSKRGHLSEVERRKVAWSQDYKCNHCHDKLPFTFEVDHIRALSLSGEDCIDNMQALCNNCHAAKTIGDNRRASALRKFRRTGKSSEI